MDFGLVITSNNVPEILGFRRSVVDTAPLGFLARVALHEGAHLASFNESDAQWVEDNCTTCD